jgi:hypothetical protein
MLSFAACASLREIFRDLVAALPRWDPRGERDWTAHARSPITKPEDTQKFNHIRFLRTRYAVDVLVPFRVGSLIA